MQDILIEQLNGMRETLSKNIESIKSLIGASKSLGELISELSKEDDGDTIKTLESTRKEIDESIDNLIQQTDELFDAYAKLVENI